MKRFLFFSRILHPYPPSPIPQCRTLHEHSPANSTILAPVTAPPPTPDGDGDDTVSEFLSRVVHSLRPTLSAAFPTLPRPHVDSMLLLICKRLVSEIDGDGDGDASPPVDLSPDLWDAVRAASAAAHEAMRREWTRAELRKHLHSDDVKQMCRFAGDVGVRGQLLRELRFKWAREKLEEVEFYRTIEKMREQERKEQEAEKAANLITSGGEGGEVKESGEGGEDKEKDAQVQPLALMDSLPQRKGKIKYKIYGLDLSGPEWAEVAEKVEVAEGHFVPDEPKPIEGRCKKVDERILGLGLEDDPSPVLAEWKELLEPKKVDWLMLLERIKERSLQLYLKVAELILDEETFEADVRDYSRLIDAHTKTDRLVDAERILHKMTEKGIVPDLLTSIVLVHMYSKAGNLELASKAFVNLRQQGLKPDMKVYSSMIMAYVKAGEPKLGDSLIREMETEGIRPTKEMYIEVLRAFAERGQIDGAQRTVNTMQLTGIQPSLESYTLLIQAYAQGGDPDQARGHFDQMMKIGIKPDDHCTASVIEAYSKKNLLDKALDLLLKLEKDGFQRGIRTYSTLVDWMGRLQLVDEAENLLRNITEKGDTPFDLHVSLCDMYCRASRLDKARKSLKILEASKQLLQAHQYERIVRALLAGGAVEDAKRIYGAMQAQGFTPSQQIEVAIMAAQPIPRPWSFTRGKTR